MKKILIAIPSYKYVEVETFKSVFDLKVPDGYITELKIIEGNQIDTLRNKIGNMALDYDYVFCIDSDIVLPVNALEVLLSMNVGIASGIYRQRKEEQILEVYRYGQTGMYNAPPNEVGPLTQVAACGFGCVLVKSDVFREIKEPYFEYHYALDHKNTISEDVDFCMKASKHGYNTYVTTNVICDHIGGKTFRVS